MAPETSKIGDEMKTERKDIQPRCPHCEARIKELVVVKNGWFADHRVYCCPECEKIIGISSNFP